VVAQREDLHETLAGEYHNEYHVEIVQYVAERVALLIMVQCHRKHVEPDEQHDYHIELLVRHYFKHYRLRPPLRTIEKGIVSITRFIISSFFL
jgi:hypothetical protein